MVELNCDMGEGRADDCLFMPYIQRCNIACGGHAGNLDITRATITAALENKVIIGAHPSYPDRENFGRQSIQLSREALQDSIFEQLEYLAKLVELEDGKVQHLKAHGALYNDLAKDAVLADAFCEVIINFSPSLEMIGLADSEISRAADNHDIHFIPEAFCDRRYEDDLSLTSREHPNALITDLDEAVQQLNQIVLKQVVTTASGRETNLKAATICIHSDTPNALAIARAAYAAQKSW